MTDSNYLRSARKPFLLILTILFIGYVAFYSTLDGSVLYRVHGFPSWHRLARPKYPVRLSLSNSTPPTLASIARLLLLSSDRAVGSTNLSTLNSTHAMEDWKPKAYANASVLERNSKSMVDDRTLRHHSSRNSSIREHGENSSSNTVSDGGIHYKVFTRVKPPSLAIIPTVGIIKPENSSSIDQIGAQDKHSKHSSVESSDPNSEYGTSQLQGNRGEHCDIDSIKSWQKGVVTQLNPPIQRNCKKLFDSSKSEMERVKSRSKHWRNVESKNDFVESMRNCSYVWEEFSGNFYVSQQEEEFPIAYVFVVYTNVQQVVRLLKSIYRSQNLYCIHPDARQGKTFSKVFYLISECLDNVFVASKLERVYYAHHSIMDAQLNCMRDLEKHPLESWKYVINLCGREVPLKTNRQIVRSLMGLQGFTALSAHKINYYFLRKRFVHKYALNHKGNMYDTRKKIGSPPYGIRLMKSMNFMAASRTFVHFLLSNKKAIAFRKYLRDVYAPEEHFYSSLYCLPEAPGAKPPKSIKVPTVDKSIWVSTASTRKRLCKSRMIVHIICILSYADLPTLRKYAVLSEYFFMNKYFMEWDHVIMDCMEEKLVERNKVEYRRDCG